MQYASSCWEPKELQESLPGKREKVIADAVPSRDQPHEKVQTKGARRRKNREDGILLGNHTPFISYPDLDCSYFSAVGFY